MSPAPAAGRTAGFSLIELMVTVAIVAILAAIAIPSYRSYVMQGNRTDAIRSLTFYQQALERCYSQNYTYVGCAQIPAMPVASTDGYYQITGVFNQSNYTLTATASGIQANDTQCTTLVVNQTGAQTAQDNMGNDQTQACWAGH